MKTAFFIVALVAAIPFVASAQTASVAIDGEGISPKTLAVPPGTTVTWQNGDGRVHRLVSTAGPAAFDSMDLQPFDTFSYVFTLPGTYAYHDGRNPSDFRYQGRVVVGTTAGTPGPRATAAGAGVARTIAAGGAAGPGRPLSAGIVVAVVTGVPVAVTIALALALRRPRRAFKDA